MAVVLILEDDSATVKSIADVFAEEGFVVLRLEADKIDALDVAHRLRERLRTRDAPAPTAIEIGELFADLQSRVVRRGATVLDLAPRERELLILLMRNADRVVDRKTIFEQVWQYEHEGYSNVVDVHVGRLRRKLEAAGVKPAIHTVRGVGYVLTAG